MNTNAEYPRDPMTGLYRYDALPQLLIDVLNAASYQHPESVALLIVDVDRYKWILAEHGTPAGDHFLIEITAILLSNMPDDAQIVRSGGAEFSILIPRISLEQAQQMAESLVKIVEIHTLRFKNSYEESPREIRDTITIGGVVARMGTHEEMNAALYWIAARGYSALRQAKKYGYGRAVVDSWSPPSEVAKYLLNRQSQ